VSPHYRQWSATTRSERTERDPQPTITVNDQKGQSATGRNSSLTQSLDDAAAGRLVAFGCTGQRILPTISASFVVLLARALKTQVDAAYFTK
jgi:hypothetical protein